MAFGKRTDDVIGSVPNNPKLTKYIIRDYKTSNKISDDEKLVKRLNHIKDDLFNNFENDEDIHFLSFDEDNYIPITENFSKLKKFFLDSTKEIYLEISNKSHNSGDFLFTTLIDSKLNDYLNEINPLNAYFTIGFIDFESFQAPLFFVPIIINKNIIRRDYNKDIKFNYFLKSELKNEYDIELPDIHVSIEEYIEELKKIENFNISLNKSFIGNFYFRKLLIYNDLNLDYWDNSLEKFNSFFNNDYISSISDFKNLNDNIASKWPSLDLKYNKDFKMKGADKLITNLLSQGNSILYVSNYYSKNEVKKSLNNKHLNSLILDFDYNSTKYDIFKDMGKSLVSFNEKQDISKLADLKIYNTNMLNILKEDYLNTNLTPFEIQQKIDEYSYYDYDINFDFDDFSFDEINQITEDIKEISNNVNLKNIICNCSGDINFSNVEYSNLIELHSSIQEKLVKFQLINKDLNKKFGITLFDNLELPQYLENFSYIDDQSKYIVKEDYDNINEFLKVHNEYQNLKNNGINSVSKKINNITNNIVYQKDELEKFNDKIDEINSIAEYLDLSDLNFEDLIKYLSLLSKHPTIVENENELKETLNIIEKYQNQKDFNGTLIDKLKNFWVEYEFVDEMLNECKIYLTNTSEELIIFNNIKNLSNLFNEAGFNFKTLNDYNNLKDKLNTFENAKYITNEKYFQLNVYLKEFLKNHDDSIKSYLNKINSQFESILNEIQEIIHNRYSVDYKKDLFLNINEIIELQKKLGFNFNNFEELVENEEFIKYLNSGPKFNSNFSNTDLVNNFEVINNFDISTNVSDYIDSKINDLISVMHNINDLGEKYLKNNYELNYITLIIQEIVSIKEKIGININSINDFSDNENILDILIQNPKLNYNIEDYDLYLDINKICQEYDIYDIESLLTILDNECKGYQKSINKKIKPILNSEYDLRFIKDKIRDINDVIVNLSKLVKCRKIDKFNEIDNFINNIKILKDKPTYIDNSDDFELYFETINYLNNTLVLNEEFLNDCDFKLNKLDNLDKIDDKFNELENIINICYDNDTSIDLLDIKKEFRNLKESIEKLNISFDIVDNIDLEECIDSLKPNYKVISDTNLKDSKSINSCDDENFNIENSILKENNSNLKISSKNYILMSKNHMLVEENTKNYLLNNFSNKPVFNYLKNKNVLKKDIIKDIELLKDYLNNFDELKDKISHYIASNIDIIKEYNAKEELYYNKIERILEDSCPNSFKGIKSNIHELKQELTNNKYFTELVESGFFEEMYYSDLSLTEINKEINELQKSEKELIKVCRSSDFNLDDTFENILNYIHNLLVDIDIFKQKGFHEIFSLDYLKEYISDDLLFKYTNLTKNIVKLTNLDDTFINKYFKENYGVKIKDNIKLVDKFNNLIKNGVFSDNTIKFLENNPQRLIENEVNKLKIYIASIRDDLIKKEFNLDDSFNTILNKIEKISNDNYIFKKEINENSYYLKLVNFNNYNEYSKKFISFIDKHYSKFNLNNQQDVLKQIFFELDKLNEICCYENYKNNLLSFNHDQINNELLKLKNNLKYVDLIKKGYINYNIPKNTIDLVNLIDETKELINENDYTVTFEELIKYNENEINILNQFDEKCDNIFKKLSDNYMNFSIALQDIENLFNEYSVQLSPKFNDLSRTILNTSNLFNLSNSLDDNLVNLSKLELIEYSDTMDLNKEFTDLINSNVFSNKVCDFYKENTAKDKLEEMENLSLEITNFITINDLDKNLEDIVDSNIEKLFIGYSEIIQLKEKNLNNSGELIEKNSLILEKLFELISYNIFLHDYRDELSELKEKLENLTELYEFELTIHEKKDLIEGHFNEILNSKSVSLDNLYKKYELDLEFTNYYNNGVFSEKTIKNITNLQNFNLRFDSSVLELYDSNDYLDVYSKNKFLINEINNYNTGVTNQTDFLINVNELLNNEDIENYLNLDINSQLNDLESRLLDLAEIGNKYQLNDEESIVELKNHIAYTELIDNKLCDDENLIKSNLKAIRERLPEVNDIYFSLLNDLFKISQFYKRYPYFSLNQDSFRFTISFEILEGNLSIFKQNLDDLNEINKFNPKIISLIKQLHEKNIDLNKSDKIFSYNMYTNLLNEFYDEYPNIKGKNLNYNNYKKELDKIDKKINKNRFNQVLTEIYSKLHERSNDELLLNQRELLNQKIINENLGTIKETLNEFKDYILNIKPIFMMDINQFYEYISNQYESSFDYVILDKNFEFEELDNLSLFLRSKNKLIDLR